MSKNYLKGHRLFNYVHAVKAGFRNMFMNCRRFGWTHEFMLQKRNEYLNSDNWKRLTVRDQAELFGYWEALHDTLFDELEGMYFIADKWYTPRQVSDNRLSDQASHNNYHKVHIMHDLNGSVHKIYC